MSANKENISRLTLLYIVTLFINITILVNHLSAKESFKLEMPLSCEYGVTCFIQNYVDADKNEDQYTDYTCGDLSYNGHKGTDFRLLDFAALTEGYQAIAAADGVIKATRSKEADFAYIEKKFEDLKNKECGNGIVITHQNGYETQYCHLLKDSIKVKVGQQVTTGQALGFVGISGNSEFPHLHISVRKDGKIIDPFTGLTPGRIDNCNVKKSKLKPLWSSELLKTLAYKSTAILNFNTTDKIPEKLRARSGEYRENKITQASDKIILWADIMGIKKDDNIIFELLDKNNNKMFRYNKIVQKKYALYFLYSGKNLENLKLSKDKYRVKVMIYRDNNKILSSEKVLDVI